MGKQIQGKWSDICLQWGKCTETPRNASDGHKVFAFAPPYILCSLCFPWHLPPTDKLVDPPHPPPPPSPPCSGLSSKATICILNAPEKWLPSQLLSPCLADKQGVSVDVTQTKYIWLQAPPPCLCQHVRESEKVLRNATVCLSLWRINTQFVNHSATIMQL